MSLMYFDNAASTCVDPEVLEAMMPYLRDCYANPSALHALAKSAKHAIEEARESVAELLGAADPSEIIFTSCATEANNTVLNIFGGRLAVSEIEHPSVRNPALKTGRCDLIPVDIYGTVDEKAYREILGKGSELVSIMSANNEIGSVQDLEKLGGMAWDADAKFHSDITQSVGKERLELRNLPIDYATLSGHKFHAPKGVGAMWVRTGAPYEPFMVGGTHEGGRRAGTLNTPYLVALGAAARVILERGEADSKRMRGMRQRVIEQVLSRVPESKLNGQPNGAPHIISLSFKGVEGEPVIIELDNRGICCTAGAACSSGGKQTSHVLNAIGLDEAWLQGTVRVSLSRFTTEDEVDSLIDALVASVEAVRGLAQAGV